MSDGNDSSIYEEAKERLGRWIRAAETFVTKWFPCIPRKYLVSSLTLILALTSVWSIVPDGIKDDTLHLIRNELSCCFGQSSFSWERFDVSEIASLPQNDDLLLLRDYFMGRTPPVPASLMSQYRILLEKSKLKQANLYSAPEISFLVYTHKLDKRLGKVELSTDISDVVLVGFMLTQGRSSRLSQESLDAFVIPKDVVRNCKDRIVVFLIPLSENGVKTLRTHSEKILKD